MVMAEKSAETSTEGDNKVGGLMKKLKFLEEERVKSFNHWQYNDNENCSVKKVCKFINSRRTQ